MLPGFSVPPEEEVGFPEANVTRTFGFNMKRIVFRQVNCSRGSGHDREKGRILLRGHYLEFVFTEKEIVLPGIAAAAKKKRDYISINK